MNVDPENRIIRFAMARVQHYDHARYWKMRAEVVNPKSRKSKLLRMIYLFRIKRADAFANASMGTDLGSGAVFHSPPVLPHHLNGIIVSHFAEIGKNVTIYQQVTIAQNDLDEAATIGDDCMIGAGARILGKVHIGDRVRIGANAVVVTDIPSDATAVGVPARIILHRNNNTGETD